MRRTAPRNEGVLEGEIKPDQVDTPGQNDARPRFDPACLTRWVDQGDLGQASVAGTEEEDVRTGPVDDRVLESQLHPVIVRQHEEARYPTTLDQQPPRGDR